MTTVGTFTAKTHLTRLLDQVAQGEKVLITRRGKPIAMLVPPKWDSQTNVGQVVREMLEFRRRSGPSLGPGLNIRKLVEEGRRS